MANEITVQGGITCFKSSIMTSALYRTFPALQFTMTANYYVEGTILVGTSATLIPLGAVTTPHWAYFKNLDATNFLRLMNGSAGAKLPKLKPGEPALFPLDDTAVPYAQADTAACLLEYLIFGL